MKIVELEVGSSASLQLVLVEASVRKTNSRPPRPFLQTTLTDGLDQITGMLWQWNMDTPTPKPGLVYHIAGQVGEYQGRKQLTLNSLRVSEDQDTSAFEATYACSPGELLDKALTAISQMKNEGLKGLCSYIYSTYAQQITRSSSAMSVHHVGAGGNLAHTVDVMEVAELLAGHYSTLGYELDKDLVVAGALLHDIGKPETYIISGPSIDYTEAGQLFDHIILGIELLAEANAQTRFMYNDQAELLKHIIASHHGQKEYGSPVTPRFIEAYLVSLADGISATLDTLWQANIKAAKEGKDMTDRIYTQGNQAHFLQRSSSERLAQRASET